MASLSESIYPGSSARIHGLMGLGTRDNGHRYAGRDKEKTIFTKDNEKTKYNNGYKQIKIRIFICLSEIYDLFGP